MSLDHLPFNIFDLVLIGMIVGGILQGRKHGMSEELLDLLKWLAIVVVCGTYYEPVGKWVFQSTSFSLLSCFVGVYLGGALIIYTVIGLARHRLGGKLVGSDIFGRMEYYLGMCSGLVRFLCILVVGLSVLNARAYSTSEIQAQEAYQKKWFESDLFPTLPSVQHMVFKYSLTGPWLKEHLSSLLIRPTALETKRFQLKDAQLP